MRRLPIEPHTPVTVTWEDAYGGGNDSYGNIAEALASYKPRIRVTIGYFVGYATAKDGSKAVVVGTDDDRDSETPDGIGGLIVTPIDMVRDIRIIESEGKKRQRKRSS